MTGPDEDHRPQFAAPSLRALLRRDLWAMAACGGATLAVVLGSYGLARASGAAPHESLVVSLAAAAMWVALSCGPMAAGAEGNWSAALRGAVPADASLVAMLVLWPLARSEQGGCYLTAAGILKAWCVLAAMAAFSVAAVCCGRRRPGRAAISLAAAVVLAAAIAGPFWTSGIVHSLGSASGMSFDAWAIRANPFYSVTGAVAERLRFIWHETGLMYWRVGTFRAFPPPPIHWYSAAAIYAGLGGILAFVAFMRRGKGE